MILKEIIGPQVIGKFDFSDDQVVESLYSLGFSESISTRIQQILTSMTNKEKNSLYQAIVHLGSRQLEEHSPFYHMY